MLSLLEIQKPSKEDCLEILKNPYKSYLIAYENCKRHLEKDNYYQSLFETFNKKVNIITTNYTPYADIVFGTENVASVHGKLNWFESVHDLQTYELDDSFEYGDDVRFPYILLQSAIKPIIEPRQISEYAKANSFLQSSKILVVIGFSLNIDDNHINSIIKSFLEREGTKLVFFNINDFDLKKINRILRSNYREEKIEIVNITKEKCIQQFDLYLNRFKEESK